MLLERITPPGAEGSALGPHHREDRRGQHKAEVHKQLRVLSEVVYNCSFAAALADIAPGHGQLGCQSCHPAHCAAGGGRPRPWLIAHDG